MRHSQCRWYIDIDAMVCIESLINILWGHLAPAGSPHETRETGEGLRSNVRDFRNFEPRTSDRAFFDRLTLHAPRSPASGLMTSCAGVPSGLTLDEEGGGLCAS